MAITTYNDLKDAITGGPNSWSKRGDIGSRFDDFVGLAEADIWEELRIRDMEFFATGTLSTTNRYLAFPTDFLESRALKLVSGSLRYEVSYSAPESLVIQPAPGRPKHYTLTDRIEFDRVSDSAYTYEMYIYRSLTGLSSSNQTNAVLTRFPSIYLYGCLFHFAQWAQNDLMLTKYAPLFLGSIEKANKADRRNRYPAGKSMRVEGSTP